MEKSEKKQSFFVQLEKFHKENAEILEGFEGFPIPEDEYDKKIAKMWSE